LGIRITPPRRDVNGRLAFEYGQDDGMLVNKEIIQQDIMHASTAWFFDPAKMEELRAIERVRQAPRLEPGSLFYR